MMKIKRFGCVVLTLAILIGILMLPSCSEMGVRDKARSGAGTDGSTALTTVAATTASARKGEFAVRVGETEIQPLRCFNWTEDCDPQSGGVTYGCGFGISDVFYEGNQEEIAAIPRVCAGGEISILNAGSNWTLSDISVYRYEDGELIRGVINSFLRSLPKEKRQIFIRRYWYMSPICDIAADFGMSEGKVKMLLMRLRKELKKSLEREGVTV